MASPSDPNQNHLLSALLDADFDRLAPHLEPVAMRLGDVLYESGGKLSHVYFPTTAIVSLHYVLENGSISVHGPAESLKTDPKVIAAYLGGGH